MRFAHGAVALCLLVLVSASTDAAVPSKYDQLLANPRIRATVSWWDANARRLVPSDRWDPALTTLLSRHLETLDAGGRFPKLAPQNIEVLTEQEAREIYITRVAISLWADVNRRVSWSLLDYDDNQLLEILSPRRLFRYDAATGYRWMQPVADLDPYGDYVFMTSVRSIPYLATERKILASSHEQTIVALVDRLRTLRHRAEGDDLSPTGPPVDEILESGISSGCWGTSGVIVSLLRSVNIPSARVNHTLDDRTHSSVLFSTIGKTLFHADDPYNRLLLAMPSKDLLIDNAATWLPMATDRRLQDRFNAVRKTTCVNLRAILEMSCGTKLFHTIYGREIEPYITPEEAHGFLERVNSMSEQFCASFSADAPVVFPMSCWSGSR